MLPAVFPLKIKPANFYKCYNQLKEQVDYC